MRTTRKQFPVNWLTSGRLAITISARQSEAVSTNKKMMAQVECMPDTAIYYPQVSSLCMLNEGPRQMSRGGLN